MEKVRFPISDWWSIRWIKIKKKIRLLIIYLSNPNIDISRQTKALTWNVGAMSCVSLIVCYTCVTCVLQVFFCFSDSLVVYFFVFLIVCFWGLFVKGASPGLAHVFAKAGRKGCQRNCANSFCPVWRNNSRLFWVWDKNCHLFSVNINWISKKSILQDYSNLTKF